ncbi:MAG: FAD-dependent oxidoreductase [Candidatus Cloacimonetes bacterium]|nr:FAD-dependent oxidoreductase [Candidatus Cloacimonadota bacterium]
MKKYLIVGGVAGGASTAARLRRNDETAQIILFERGKYISYANCGLPYYIGGVIKKRDKLFVQTVEEFSKRFNIDIRTLSEVRGIDKQSKKIKVVNLETGETYQETYDILVLSPGAQPIIPPIKGNDLPGIFVLRNVEDTDRIKQFIEQHHPKRVTVIGAGYIGIEMVENLHNICSEVSLIEMADRILPFFDFEMSSALSHHIRSEGVKIYLNEKVNSLEQTNEGIIASLESGMKIKTDMVIFATGIKPDTAWLRNSGLELSDNGSIVVTEYLQTNDPDIYAVGDAIKIKHQILQQDVNAFLAGPASKQGRIVADNIVLGNKRKFNGVIGNAIIKVFDLTAGIVGASEQQLKLSKVSFRSAVIHASSHAGYYPNALPISLKLFFTPQDGEILGAQIIGFKGVDKRLDVISAFIQKRGTVFDLTEFEHSYAPPYSSARDPLTIVGFVSENMIKGKFKTIEWSELGQDNYQQSILLDVRSKEEYELGSIPDSINIPLDDLRERWQELPKDKDIIIYCLVGLRGYLACRLLLQKGFDRVYNLSGGYKTYQFIFGRKDGEEGIYDGETILPDDQIYPEEDAFLS